MLPVRPTRAADIRHRHLAADDAAINQPSFCRSIQTSGSRKPHLSPIRTIRMELVEVYRTKIRKARNEHRGRQFLLEKKRGFKVRVDTAKRDLWHQKTSRKDHFPGYKKHQFPKQHGGHAKDDGAHRAQGGGAFDTPMKQRGFTVRFVTDRASRSS
jgi:hypothetical protein